MIGLFNTKLKLFVTGRQSTFKTLSETISNSDFSIWIHTASLGEFEQGLPVIETLKRLYPDYKIVISFFSPSGYEVKKNHPIADAIVYLPIDTKSNAVRFVNTLNPRLAIFVKYEFWPNYLYELKKQQIPTLLVSGIFRPNQLFFKSYGVWMKNALNTFDHFFVQNNSSKQLLNSIDFQNVTINGDTRYDRVCEILSLDNSLPYIETFKNNTLTVVYGSSWEDDEDIYLDFLNSTHNIKHIIAPHNIKAQKIESLVSKIKKPTVRFSEMKGEDLTNYDVFILDTIGILTKVYSYADIAYVGGGFKTGLHNTLEPAVYGIPVIIGPKYDKFQEAIDLVNEKGIVSVKSKSEYNFMIKTLITDDKFRKNTGYINRTFIENQSGATSAIIDYIKSVNI